MCNKKLYILTKVSQIKNGRLNHGIARIFVHDQIRLEFRFQLGLHKLKESRVSLNKWPAEQGLVSHLFGRESEGQIRNQIQIHQ